jgi:hypothetical protein
MVGGRLGKPPAIAALRRGIEHVEAPVDRAQRPLPAHRPHRARGQRVADQHQPRDRVERLAVLQPQPAPDARKARPGLLLGPAQLEVLDEVQPRGPGESFLLLGRAGPGIGDWGGMERVWLARGAEHEGGGKTDVLAQQQLAAELGDIAPGAQHAHPGAEAVADRAGEGNLRRAQRGEARMRAHRGGIGDQRRCPAIERAPLHPPLRAAERDRAVAPGDRIGKRGDRHARLFTALRGSSNMPIAHGSGFR